MGFASPYPGCCNGLTGVLLIIISTAHHPIMKANFRVLTSVLLLAFAAMPLAAQEKKAESAKEHLQIPETDDGLPGTGPIRRADWFRKTWSDRRSAWAARGEKDRGAVVLLGDSITQGWGDDFTAAFPGMKIANRGISGDTSRGVRWQRGAACWVNIAAWRKRCVSPRVFWSRRAVMTKPSRC